MRLEWIDGVPDHWKVAESQFVLDHQKREVQDDDEIVTAFRDGQVTLRSKRRTDGFTMADKEIGYQHICEGDLVVHSMDGGFGAIGVSDSCGKASPVVHAYTSDSCDLRFISYQLRSAVNAGWIAALAKGIRVRSTQFDRPALAGLKIAYPSLESQQRIADYLDRETAEIDAAVADLNRYLELLNVKLESTAREIFTTLSEERQLIQTKFLVDITTGSGDTQDAQEDGEYPFYVRSDTIQRSGDYEFDCDAVLTSGDGAGVGKIFHLASGKFKAHQRVYVMHNFRRISPEYFYWMFKSAFPDVIRYGGAKSTVDSVRMPMIANLKLPVPDNSTQEEISGRLANLHEEVGSLIAESTKLRDLLLKRRSVLITEVVTGRKQV